MALLAIGIAAAVGYAVWQYDTVRDLTTQQRIWRTGVRARSVEVSGRVKTSRGIFHDYELEVEYEDEQQVRHKDTLKFDTLVGEVNQASEPVVHYLKDDPHQYALSWAMDVTASRWGSIGFLGLAGVGLVGGSFSFLGWRALRRLLDAQRCAQRSDEVIVQITKVKQHTAHGSVANNEIFFAGSTADGRPVTGDVMFSTKFEPLWADASGQRMVALVPPENLKRAVVLRSDFWPFDLNPDEQARVRAAIAARDPGITAG